MTKVLCDRLTCVHCINQKGDFGECTQKEITMYVDGGCDSFDDEVY